MQQPFLRALSPLGNWLSGLTWLACVALGPCVAVALFNREINLILKSEETQKAFQTQGMDPAGTTSPEFGRVVERDANRWAQLIKTQQIKAD